MAKPLSTAFDAFAQFYSIGRRHARV